MRKNKRYAAKHVKKLKRPNPFSNMGGKFFYFCKCPIGKYLISTFATLVAEAAVVLFVLYGPISFFRELLITSAMTTLSHQYYATTFYSDETIQAVLDKHKVVPTTETTDESMIHIEEKKNEITVHEIKGKTFKGYVMEISDPSWVRLGIPANFGTKGQKIPVLVRDYGAIGGINAGGFGDANGWGNGGRAIGLVIVDGQVVQEPEPFAEEVKIVGFNEDDVLVLGYYDRDEWQDLNLRDACEFDPFLVVNGEPTDIRGNGGWGIAPRTAIGQRADGTVLLVVIDGRSVTSLGATMKDLQNVMIDEGAVNAANLDGGSSTVLYYTKEGGVMNNPSGSDADGMRFLPNAWLVIDPEKYTPPTDRPPYKED